MYKTDKSYFKIFENFVITKGISRSLITNLHYSTYLYISNDLQDILTKYNDITISQIYALFGAQNDEILNEYFEFLFEHEIIFKCSTKEELSWFPPIDLQWDFPGLISNAIINVTRSSKHPWESILKQLDELGCQTLQVRFMDDFTLNEVYELLVVKFDGSQGSVTNLEIFLHFHKTHTETKYKEFVENYNCIGLMIVDNAPNSLSVDINSYSAKLQFITESRLDDKHCGVVHPFYFSPNMSHFTESINLNTCLNRKISIDADGTIKNCPVVGNYGNIDSVNLNTVIKKDEFTTYWYLNKSRIAVCNTCEFRNICTDCRGYLQDPNDLLSKPLKCGYNPETCTWESWSTNPLNQESIEYYKLNQIAGA